MLRPGGRIWITTPNIGSWGHLRFGQDWIGLDPPRHLVVFSQDALRRLLREAGFVDLRGPMSPMSIGWAYWWSNEIRARRGLPPFGEAEVRRWIWQDSVRRRARPEELLALAIRPMSE
jgi:hypothetical protein